MAANNYLGRANDRMLVPEAMAMYCLPPIA